MTGRVYSNKCYLLQLMGQMRHIAFVHTFARFAPLGQNWGPEMAQVDFFPQFLAAQAEQILFCLERDTAWSRAVSSGRRVNAVYGDSGLIYRVEFNSVKGTTISERATTPWNQSELVTALRDQVSQVTGQSYNFCIIQRYPNGTVGIKPHRDREMVAGTTIAGLSFGATRTLRLDPVRSTNVAAPIELTLTPGSLYVLKPPTNDLYLHSIPTDATTAARLSLTFRNVPM